MSTFTVCTDTGREVEVQAEYHVADEDFVVFKTADHKQVAAFNSHRVESIVRSAPTSAVIGHVTVNVVPQLDEAAFADLLKKASRRAGKSLGLA